MLSTNKKRFPKKLIITAGVVILLIAGALTYVYAFNGNLFGWTAPRTTTTGNTSIDYGPPTSEQKKSGTQTKSGSTNSSDTPPAPTPITGSTKKTVQVTITAANQNGSTLQIRTLIGAVEDTGTCALTLTRTGQTTVTKTAGTQALASTSTCKGFDVPTSELSTGAWQVLITYDSSTLTGSATKVITLQ